MDKNNVNQSDNTRSLLAWAMFALVLILLLLLKPAVAIQERSMFLPLLSNLPELSQNDVEIVNTTSSLYKRVGYLTVIVPYKDKIESEYLAVNQAKLISAKAGANKLFLQIIGPQPWIDTDKPIIRLNAVAMK